jgi:hypothetical protein
MALSGLEAGQTTLAHQSHLPSASRHDPEKFQSQHVLQPNTRKKVKPLTLLSIPFGFLQFSLTE